MSATHWTDKLQMCGLFHWQQLWLIGGLQLSRAHSTISKVLIKSFWPVEEFLDHENLEYCRLPKNFEFMIVVFYIKYAIIVLKLGSVAFKFWIVNILYLESVINWISPSLKPVSEYVTHMMGVMLILYWWRYDSILMVIKVV